MRTNPDRTCRRRAWLLPLVLLAPLWGCVSEVDGWPMSTGPLDLDPVVFTESPFGDSGDRDGDCLLDEAEHVVAMHFRPAFVFDSREVSRRPNEPVVLYQVHNARAPDAACAAVPQTIEVTYAYLFSEDGGYTASTFCSDRHHGDNQYLRVLVEVTDGGTSFALRSVWNWGFSFPGTAMRVMDRSHPLIFLSAGKHHPFFDTLVDGHASPYSSWRCTEAMDGRGITSLSLLELESAPGGRMNVGERSTHPAEFFVGELSRHGFAGETAWGAEPFCGGRPRDGCGSSTNPMGAIWR